MNGAGVAGYDVGGDSDEFVASSFVEPISGAVGVYLDHLCLVFEEVSAGESVNDNFRE